MPFFLNEMFVKTQTKMCFSLERIIQKYTAIKKVTHLNVQFTWFIHDVK